MAIDVRAEVTCSLGTVISGSLGDDYLQGNGLIKTQGSVLISGLISPPMGTIVTFSYTKEGITRSIPRKMRVLSSFADPYRRTTQVELGCKLTYTSDLKESIKWSAFNDPLNSEYEQEDARIVTLPISAASIAQQCLSKIGLISSSMPLTNQFSIEEFDFSGGYVDILSDLLISESYFGYLDQNEVLQIQSLDQEGGVGPVLTNSEIIDIGPIGVGQLPGEAVTVSYSTLRLKVPPPEVAEGGIGGPIEEEEEALQEAKRIERINWELIETSSTPETYYVSYKLTNDEEETEYTAEYSGSSSSTIETDYEVIRVKPEPPQEEEEDEEPNLVFIGNVSSMSPEDQIEFQNNPQPLLDEYWPIAKPYQYVLEGFTKWVYNGDSWDEQKPPAVIVWASDGKTEEKEVPRIRITKEFGPLISVASSVAQDFLSNGYSFANSRMLLTETYETFSYDEYGNQVGSVKSKFESKIAIAAAASLNWADETGTIPLDGYFGATYLSGTTCTERIVQENEVADGYSKDVSSSYVKQALSQDGQQQLAKRNAQSASLNETLGIIQWIMESGLVHENTTVTVSRKGITTSEERPPVSTRLNSQYAKGTNDPEEESGDDTSSGGDESTDPNGGYSTESKAEIALAVGSAAAERRLELSLPYAPDDRFTGPPGGPFFALRSDASGKAMRYGRTQNRLFLGNRNGISLQLAPEKLPVRPFDPVYIEANGLTALYRVNSASWAFDANGIVASVDALFWAAVGGTGSFWFPVAPGIVTLPETPPIVDTTPSQILGTVDFVGSSPQSVLDAAFPGASNGDGVQDETTGFFWVYEDAVWSNVGSNPGPTMTAENVVLPYNETSIYNARVRSIINVSKFNYAIGLLTEVPDSTVRVGLLAISSRAFILVPATDFTLDLVAPMVSAGASVFVPSTPSIVFAALEPLVSAGASVAVPEVLIVFTIYEVAYAGSEATVLQTPAANIELNVYSVDTFAGKSIDIPVTSIIFGSPIPLINPPIDPNFSSVSLLLHMNGANNSTTFTDSSLNALSVSILAGSPVISTAQSKFGGASALFPNGNDYLRVSSPLVNLGGQTNSWTVEQWVYVTSTSLKGLWHNGLLTTNTNSWSCFCQFSGSNFRVVVTGVNANFNTEFSAFSGSYPYALNTWHHVAVSHNGTTLRVYVNGSLHASATAANWGLTLAPGDLFWIGAYRSSGSTLGYMQGYLDDIRITKGVARYTSNFTAPTAPFPDM